MPQGKPECESEYIYIGSCKMRNLCCHRKYFAQLKIRFKNTVHVFEH